MLQPCSVLGSRLPTNSSCRPRTMSTKQSCSNFDTARRTVACMCTSRVCAFAGVFGSDIALASRPRSWCVGSARRCMCVNWRCIVRAAVQGHLGRVTFPAAAGHRCAAHALPLRPAPGGDRRASRRAAVEQAALPPPPARGAQSLTCPPRLDEQVQRVGAERNKASAAALRPLLARRPRVGASGSSGVGSPSRGAVGVARWPGGEKCEIHSEPPKNFSPAASSKKGPSTWTGSP